jgi:large subunit ribosomal protein L21
MKYAIVESGGKQYRAVEGGLLEVDRLPVEAGENFKLEQTLLMADGENITVGTPLVKDSPVWTKVIEHFKGEKVTIFNYSPKKRIRVKTGHRQNYTRLLVEQIGGSVLVKREPAKPVEKVVKPAEVETEAVQTKAEKPVKVAPKAASTASKEKKPATKTTVKVEKASPAKTKAAPAKAAEKKPAKPAAKPATSKPAAKKPAAKKPAEKK